MPPFQEVYGLKAVMTSGVDLLKGMAKMMHMDILEIPGVTDGPDNDYRAQICGAIGALQDNDLAVVHIEAPDEAGHAGSLKEKVEAIEQIDEKVVSVVRNYAPGTLRVLIMPDHPTPIAKQTHTDEPVPFLLWGPGIAATGAHTFSEREARQGGVVVERACEIRPGSPLRKM
jgi:2,3-bisphosphoglycerate-independent phosphoglycerate mutase